MSSYGHGGRRPRRWIPPLGEFVSCAGRWGRRRVHVSQCWFTLRAEDVYERIRHGWTPPLQSGRLRARVGVPNENSPDGTSTTSTSRSAQPDLAPRSCVSPVPAVPRPFDAPICPEIRA